MQRRRGRSIARPRARNCSPRCLGCSSRSETSRGRAARSRRRRRCVTRWTRCGRCRSRRRRRGWTMWTWPGLCLQWHGRAAAHLALVARAGVRRRGAARRTPGGRGRSAALGGKVGLGGEVREATRPRPSRGPPCGEAKHGGVGGACRGLGFQAASLGLGDGARGDQRNAGRTRRDGSGGSLPGALAPTGKRRAGLGQTGENGTGRRPGFRGLDALF